MQIREHLKTRKFDSEIHKVWIDEPNSIATFPLYNLSGTLKGYQQYRPKVFDKKSNDPRKSRYYTYRKGGFSVWGLESFHFTNQLFVLEGIFDACRLTNEGYSAIAILSSGMDKSVINFLNIVSKTREVITISDGDIGGSRLKKRQFKNIDMPEGHDLASVDECFFQNFLVDMNIKDNYVHIEGDRK